MHPPQAIRLAGLVWLTAALAVACDDVPTSLHRWPGAMEVTFTTTGAEIDPDGYRLTVDTGFPMIVAPNGSMAITRLTPGVYQLTLHDLASNCQIAGSNPRFVTVRPAKVERVNFTVTCVQYTGTIRVTTATSGADLDPNGYSVSLDDGPAQPITINGSVTFSRIPQGEHNVRLTDVARNCTVEGSNPRPATVVPGATTDVAFTVRCPGSGSLRVITATSGVELDPNGYSARIQSQQVDTVVALATNGTVMVTTLPAGDIDITLHGISANCDITGTSKRTVAIPSGSTAEVRFDVLCAAATELAFVNDHDGDPEIYLIRSSGANATRLTTNAASDGSPAWSPDGTRIAFHSNRDGNSEIYVMNADGSNPVRLTNNSVDDYSPNWSPDGGKLVFTSNRDGNGEIYAMNVDGTGPVRLTSHDSQDSDPAWSADGQKIAFASNRDGDNEIYVMNADGSGVTALTSNTDDDWSPAWSPDGTRIAFARGVDCYYGYCQYELFVMSATGSGITQLTSSSCDEYDPAWSPDGRQIAFTSSQSYYGYDPCPTSVMIIRADGTSITQLTNGGASAPAWRP